MLLSGKPQVGFGAILFQLEFAYREKKVKDLIPLFVAVGINLPFAVQMVENTAGLVGKSWNISLFPYMIPVGIFLLVVGLREKNLLISAVASVFISPYVALYSYSIVAILFASQGGRYKNGYLAVLLILTWLIKICGK